MVLPTRPQDLDPVRLQDARLTRRGRATIAGLACTDYTVESRRGQGTVCLTDDGVALRAAGAAQIRFVCLVAAPEGVDALARAHPDVPVYTAAIDRGLDANGYIRPGLGDAGDRLFGTR